MSVELAFRADGAGPAFVCLHGLLGSGRNWNGMTRGFLDRYTVVLPDLRGHGASPWAEPIDYPAMVDDVVALLDRNGWDQIALLGHSMGGKVAMHLALAHPGRVRQLIVVDIAPRPYGPGLETTLEALLRIDLAAVRRRGDADEALKDDIPDAGERAFLLQNLELKDGRAGWRADLRGLHAALPIIRDFQVPAGASYSGKSSVIRGARSGYVRAEDESVIHRLFPAATLHVVEDSGHWPHAEQPAAFVGLLNTVLL